MKIRKYQSGDPYVTINQVVLFSEFHKDGSAAAQFKKISFPTLIEYTTISTRDTKCKLI